MALPWCHRKLFDLRLGPSDSFTNFETFSKSWPSQTVPFTATTSSPSMINMPSAWNPMVLDWPKNQQQSLKPTRVPNMPLILVMGQTNPSSVFKQHLLVPQVLGLMLYATLLLHHQCQEKPNTSQTHSKFQYCHLPTNSEVLKLSTFLIRTSLNLNLHLDMTFLHLDWSSPRPRQVGLGNFLGSSPMALARSHQRPPDHLRFASLEKEVEWNRKRTFSTHDEGTTNRSKSRS